MDPITPPSGAIIGELVNFPGHASAVIEAGNKATKAFTKISDGFHGDDQGNAMYLNVPFMTSAGPIKVSFKGKIS